jgi:hypothetical protein
MILCRTHLSLSRSPLTRGNGLDRKELLTTETLRHRDSLDTPIDNLRCDLVGLHSGLEKDLAQRNAEGVEKRQKDFNHGSSGFNGWNFFTGCSGKLNAKAQGKRGFEQKDAKETKIGWNFAKRAEEFNLELRNSGK